MLRKDERRLVVSLDDLRSYQRDYATGVLDNPNEYLPAFDSALAAIVEREADRSKGQVTKDKQYYIGLRGSFGDHHVNPRTLRSIHLGKLVSLEGIVTRCTCSSAPSASSWLVCTC